MPVVVGARELVVRSQNGVYLINVPVEDVGARAARNFRIVNSAVVARSLALLELDFFQAHVLFAELAADLVEVHDGGESGLVGHEQLHVAVVDVAARAGLDDAPHALALAARAVIVVEVYLPVGEAAHEKQKRRREHRVKYGYARIPV